MSKGGSGESLLDASPFLPKVRSNKNDTDASSASDQLKSKEQPAQPAISEEGRKDLACRLEEAAIMQEQRDAETRAALAIEREASERNRSEELRQLAEMQRQREEEFRRVEDERLAKRREEEAKIKAAETEKRKLEEAKRKELEAAQDAYWKKKLAQEKAYKESRMTDNEIEEQHKLKEAQGQAEILRLAKESELRKIRMAEVKREDERSLLEKVRWYKTATCFFCWLKFRGRSSNLCVSS